MIAVVGRIFDREVVTSGYVLFDDRGRVVERGKEGTLGLTPHRVVRGAVLPLMCNGHTHLGDAIWGREPPHPPLADVVRPPHGLKHRLLASTPRNEKVEAMRETLRGMEGDGTGGTLDFREESVEGIAELEEAGRDLPLHLFTLGRPRNIQDPEEVGRVLTRADGLGLSAYKDLPPDGLERAAHEAARRGKFLALHASEDEREAIDPILALKPSLLVHLTMASEPDMERVRDAGVAVAFCPRSNALFGKIPPLHWAEKLGIPFLLGTDNVMFNLPDLFREMEFAYVASRLHHAAVKPETIVRSVFVNPWELIRKPEMAEVQPGHRALALRIPLRDLPYEVVARAAVGDIISPIPV